jgi:hypothetical protein
MSKRPPRPRWPRQEGKDEEGGAFAAPPHSLRPSSERLAEELQKLEQENGRLDPEDVVRVARRRSHPLHPYFEWSNTRAAHAYRVDQARALIREVKVRITVENRTVVSVAYVKDPTCQYQDGRMQRGYVRLHHIPPKKEQARNVLRDELARIEGALNRSRALAIALGLESEFEDVLRSLCAYRAGLGHT